MNTPKIVLTLIATALTGCASVVDTYRDRNMDFGAIKTIAVMPLENQTGERLGAERVRDAFITILLATGNVYVVPVGEVAHGASKAGILKPTAPSSEEVIKFAGFVKVDAVITGTVREYGEVRSGSTSANVISLSLQMMETETGKVVWTASSTRGGVGITDRLFGGGGKPMNNVTEDAINELIDKLFK